MPLKNKKISLNNQNCISGHMRLTQAMPTFTSEQIQLITKMTSAKNKMN